MGQSVIYYNQNAPVTASGSKLIVCMYCSREPRLVRYSTTGSQDDFVHSEIAFRAAYYCFMLMYQRQTRDLLFKERMVEVYPEILPFLAAKSQQSRTTGIAWRVSLGSHIATKVDGELSLSGLVGPAVVVDTLCEGHP